MREADYKRKLVQQVNALPSGYACRVEDKWRPGVLDMFIKPPNHPAMWAEGKIISGNLFAPTPRQYEEGKRLMAAGVPAFLVGWKSGVMYISSWIIRADIRECYTGDGKNYAEILIGYLEYEP